MGNFPTGSCGHVRRERACDGFGNIVQADDLDARIGMHHRHQARKGGDAAQHGGAAINRGPEHQRRAQDHPIEREPLQVGLGFRLAARKR